MATAGTWDKERGFNLADEILAAFLFLTEEYGFRVGEVHRDWPCWVRYVSKRAFVFVSDERMHYDLTVNVRLRGNLVHPDEPGYTLDDILDTAEAPVPQELRQFQTGSDEIAKKFLRRMAEYLKEYGRPALEGDRSFYKKMAERRDALSRAGQIEDVRRRANAAWEKKDYKTAAELYGAIARHLTPAEDKKRLYCLRKLAEMK